MVHRDLKKRPQPSMGAMVALAWDNIHCRNDFILEKSSHRELFAFVQLQNPCALKARK
jgi:hypothetical protein